MDKFDIIDDVLDFAIEREVEAQGIYLELAEMMERPAMKRVFESFADEELKHKEKLEAMKNKRELKTGETATDLKIGDCLLDVEPAGDMDYKDALILAMNRERASFRLYTDLAEDVENENQREAFRVLTKEEARHKLFFETEYNDVVLKED